MQKQMNPAVVAGVLALAIAALGGFGYKMMQPPPYEPSPGVAGAPAVSGYTGQSAPGASSRTDPMVPPPNVLPGSTDYTNAKR